MGSGDGDGDGYVSMSQVLNARVYFGRVTMDYMVSMERLTWVLPPKE